MNPPRYSSLRTLRDESASPALLTSIDHRIEKRREGHHCAPLFVWDCAGLVAVLFARAMFRFGLRSSSHYENTGVLLAWIVHRTFTFLARNRLQNEPQSSVVSPEY